jgi:hypothetical protein
MATALHLPQLTVRLEGGYASQRESIIPESPDPAATGRPWRPRWRHCAGQGRSGGGKIQVMPTLDLLEVSVQRPEVRALLQVWAVHGASP